MATNLYINPDNTIGGLESGKVMVAPTQEEFEDCCCESVPCTDCTGAQPAADVVISGSCGGEWYCSDADGAYQFYGFSPYSGGFCSWRWDLDFEGYSFSIQLLYHVAAAKFYIRLVFNNYLGSQTIFGGSETVGGATNVKDVTSTVSCDKSSGKITGTCQLDGMAGGGGADCTGCTATIALGG